jgi:predicted CoA-binding protein
VPLGIASAEARAIAEQAGLLYVEDRCLIIEQRRLGLSAPGVPPGGPAG